MRCASRLSVVLWLCAGLFAPLVGLVASCTDAVGIEECRLIETARCESAQQCGFTEDESLRCSEFYHDQCLHGIENAEEPPADTEAEACVNAIKAVAGCAKRGAQTMQDCPEAPLVPAAPATTPPCSVILRYAHLLTACSFVSSKDAGTASTPDSSGDADGE